MKKARSKQKTAASSKRQQPKKVTRKHKNHKAQNLCSCVGKLSKNDNYYQNEKPQFLFALEQNCGLAVLYHPLLLDWQTTSGSTW